MEGFKFFKTNSASIEIYRPSESYLGRIYFILLPLCHFLFEVPHFPYPLSKKFHRSTETILRTQFRGPTSRPRWKASSTTKTNSLRPQDMRRNWIGCIRPRGSWRSLRNISMRGRMCVGTWRWCWTCLCLRVTLGRLIIMSRGLIGWSFSTL